MSAHVAQSAYLFGHEVIGSGSYLEQRSNQSLLFRLEMSVRTRVDEPPSNLLQVSDGRFLWNYRKLQGSESLSRVNLEQAQQRIDQVRGGADLDILQSWPGLGGLPKLIHAFDAAFLFEEPESVQLQPQFPAWKVLGRWRPESLVKAVPKHAEEVEQGKGLRLEQLPEHLPNCVILFLGKDDLFPYSIVFYRLPGTTATVEPAPTDRPSVRISFSKVRFNEAIEAATFAYQPGDLTFTDQTEALLKKMGVQ